MQAELKAPHFSLQSVQGQQVDLNDYKEKRLLIGFFRHAGCPFCNIRVHNLSKVYSSLDASSFAMIFFFESPARLIQLSSFHSGLAPIPIISDPEKIWYAAYGLEPSGYKAAMSHISTFVQTAFTAYRNKMPMHMMAAGESIKTIPAEFLIDHNLVVKKAHYSESLTDRMDVRTIETFAKTGVV